MNLEQVIQDLKDKWVAKIKNNDYSQLYGRDCPMCQFVKNMCKTELSVDNCNYYCPVSKALGARCESEGLKLDFLRQNPLIVLSLIYLLEERLNELGG